MGTLSFEPLIPPSLWMALAVVGLGLLVWYGLRRPEAIGRGRWWASLGLMGAALAAVLVVLLNPMWVTELPPPAGKPLLNVLVDDSSSMLMPDGGAGGATRYQAVATLAATLAARLENQFDVRVRTFSESSSPIDPKELPNHPVSGTSTDLASAVADSLAEDRPQGQALVLLSDGIHNAGGGVQPVLDAVRRAKSLASPIYTQTFGGTEAPIDLAVDLRSPQDLAFVGQQVPVAVRVTARGIRGGRADVALLYDGKEVGRQQVTLGSIGTPELRFWVKQDRTGLYPYEVRVEPLPGEATQANNSATYLLRVVDQPIRVLVVEGKPYWDTKFLIRTLASVPAVELDSIVRVTDGRLMRRTIARKDLADESNEIAPTAPPPAPKPAAAAARIDGAMASAAPAVPVAPTSGPSTQPAARVESWKIVADAADVFASADRLRDYQIVVIGREAEAFLTDAALTNLQEWVSHEGGALVCARGAPEAQVSQRLARLLPVKWTPAREARFRMRLTDEGRDLHWLGEDAQEDRRLSGLPTLASSAQVDRSKPLAVVLATGVATGRVGQAEPAVVYQPYGSGRVVVIEGAGMWRWAFLPPQYQRQEEVYASLWHSLLRWMTGGAALLPGQKVALRADKVSFATDEPATATLLLRDEAAKGKLPAVELIATARPGEPATSFTPAALGEDPGSFRLNFGKLPAGRYQARVAGAGAEDVASRCVFDVRVLGAEQLDLQARPDLMARIASDSGGAVLGADAVADVAAHFKEHLARTRPPRYERSTAWDRPWLLLAVFALWCLAWSVRRSGGLI